MTYEISDEHWEGLWRFARGDMSDKDFESWLMTESDLDKALGLDLYLMALEACVGSEDDIVTNAEWGEGESSVSDSEARDRLRQRGPGSLEDVLWMSERKVHYVIKLRIRSLLTLRLRSLRELPCQCSTLGSPSSFSPVELDEEPAPPFAIDSHGREIEGRAYWAYYMRLVLEWSSFLVFDNHAEPDCVLQTWKEKCTAVLQVWENQTSYNDWYDGMAWASQEEVRVDFWFSKQRCSVCSQAWLVGAFDSSRMCLRRISQPEFESANLDWNWAATRELLRVVDLRNGEGDYIDSGVNCGWTRDEDERSGLRPAD